MAQMANRLESFKFIYHEKIQAADERFNIEFN